MTDCRDSCFGCGGHLRGNVYGASNLCPECELRHERGEIDAFGRIDPLTAKVAAELRFTMELQGRAA